MENVRCDNMSKSSNTLTNICSAAAIAATNLVFSVPAQAQEDQIGSVVIQEHFFDACTSDGYMVSLESVSTYVTPTVPVSDVSKLAEQMDIIDWAFYTADTILQKAWEGQIETRQLADVEKDINLIIGEMSGFFNDADDAISALAITYNFEVNPYPVVNTAVYENSPCTKITSTPHMS